MAVCRRASMADRDSLVGCDSAVSQALTACRLQHL
jgi:hypothetical protein